MGGEKHTQQKTELLLYLDGLTLTLAVLVRQTATECLPHGTADEVLGCDEFQSRPLPSVLETDQHVEFRIGGGEEGRRRGGRRRDRGVRRDGGGGGGRGGREGRRRRRVDLGEGGG